MSVFWGIKILKIGLVLFNGSVRFQGLEKKTETVHSATPSPVGELSNIVSSLPQRKKDKELPQASKT